MINSSWNLSEGIRSSHLRVSGNHLYPISHPASGRGTFLYLLSGVLIGAFVVFMHSTLQDDPGILAESELIITKETLTPIETTKAQDIDANEENIQEERVPEQTNTSQGTNSSLGYSPELSDSPPATDESMLILAATEDVPELMATDAENISFQYIVLSKARMIPAHIETDAGLTINDSQERESPGPIFDLNIKDSYAKKADVLFGAAFSPGVNIFPEGQNRNDYSFELIAAYEKSRFLVETGLGGNYTSESAKYQINYTSFDSVGYYVGVTSFNIDPINPDSIIFETNLKNLYDSIDHYTVRETTNKYAYLQIPLRIGYRVFQTPRFSIDLKAGILFSLQIYKDIPDVPYYGNDANEIEVIRQYPDRLTTSWQYTAGVGLNYQINNNVRFSLEPFYRQYIKSAYSPSSAFPAKSPYAFGIRFGLYFHF